MLVINQILLAFAFKSSSTRNLFIPENRKIESMPTKTCKSFGFLLVAVTLNVPFFVMLGKNREV